MWCHHTRASIWLTVALAVQRYIYVCHALKARELCTVEKFVVVIGVVYVLAVASQLSRFFESDYRPIWIASKLDPTRRVEACQVTLVPFVQAHVNAYFNVYYWFRVVFIHLVPCISLVVLNALLVNAMRQAQNRRQQLLKQNRRQESRRLAESNCTTLMLVVVVAVFLVVELPLASLLIVLIFDNTFELRLIDKRASMLATLFVNMFILFSYPVNFFIYCGMSRQFRATFRGMFCGGAGVGGAGGTGGPRTMDRERSAYVSLMATENVGVQSEMAVTASMVASTPLTVVNDHDRRRSAENNTETNM